MQESPKRGKLLKFLPATKYPALKNEYIICLVSASNHHRLTTIKLYIYNNDSEMTLNPFLNLLTEML